MSVIRKISCEFRGANGRTIVATRRRILSIVVSGEDIAAIKMNWLAIHRGSGSRANIKISSQLLTSGRCCDKSNTTLNNNLRSFIAGVDVTFTRMRHPQRIEFRPTFLLIFSCFHVTIKTFEYF